MTVGVVVEIERVFEAIVVVVVAVVAVVHLDLARSCSHKHKDRRGLVVAVGKVAAGCPGYFGERHSVTVVAVAVFAAAAMCEMIHPQNFAVCCVKDKKMYFALEASKETSHNRQSPLRSCIPPHIPSRGLVPRSNHCPCSSHNLWQSCTLESQMESAVTDRR